MAAKLIVETEKLQGLEFELEEGTEWFIGRDPEESQLVLKDASISRQHLLIKKTNEGFSVENVSETNPALLNDSPIEEETLLQGGDTLTLGEIGLTFYAEDTPGQIPEEPSSETPEEAKELEETEPQEGQSEEEHPTIYREETEEDKGILAEIDFDLSETGRYLLKVIHGPNTGAEFSLQKGTSYTLGTDPASCDVVFHDTSVSRQHARLAVTDEEALTIEDLSSKNGTIVESEKIEEKTSFDPSTMITVGTTSFVVYDREGEMQTIISPMLPDIVRSLQKQEPEEEETQTAEELEKKDAEKEEKSQTALGAFILTGILLGVFVLIGISITTLFQETPVEEEMQYNITQELDKALAPFANLRYSFNNTTGRLLLVGHVHSANDKNQLMYNLQGFPFIRNIDDTGVVIDEYVWKEMNQILLSNPKWRGITIHSPRAGSFVLTGYLKTRSEADELNDYITSNFPYPDLLERRLIVEDNILTAVQSALNNAGIRNIDVRIENGQLVLSGGVSETKKTQFDQIAANFTEIPGVRGVQKFITEIGPEASLINISDKYRVSGVSRQGGNVSVVISGRILTKGDLLDGMRITDIKSSYVMLEKDGVQYRIDY